ncbi:MAG: Lin0512 family protein [Pseudomonadota bacterium]
MARKRLVVEMGMGTDLHGQDYTKAAVRALRDALWHNSLSLVPALGYSRDDMQVEVEIGVARPDQVDTAVVAEVLPYGSASVSVVKGGLDIANDDQSNITVVANAAAVVYLDVAEAGDQ